jgi:hypothetical protein
VRIGLFTQALIDGPNLLDWSPAQFSEGDTLTDNGISVSNLAELTTVSLLPIRHLAKDNAMPFEGKKAF